MAAELLAPVRELATALDRLGVHSDRSKLWVPAPAGLVPFAGPLGTWATPGRWDVAGPAREYGITPDGQVVGNDRRAAGALGAVARKAGIPVSSPYFAVVVQDLDHPLAVLVYAGGDDLLAFCPAAATLPLAGAIREQIRTAITTGPLATVGENGAASAASTGVVFAAHVQPAAGRVAERQKHERDYLCVTA